MFSKLPGHAKVQYESCTTRASSDKAHCGAADVTEGLRNDVAPVLLTSLLRRLEVAPGSLECWWQLQATIFSRHSNQTICVRIIVSEEDAKKHDTTMLREMEEGDKGRIGGGCPQTVRVNVVCCWFSIG